MAAKIDDLLQNLSATTNMQAAAEIDLLWLAIEARCVAEESGQVIGGDPMQTKRSDGEPTKAQIEQQAA